MGKKIKRKIHLLDYWDIREHEAMYEHMASQGWKLMKINNFYSVFEKTEPVSCTFRYDVFKKTDHEKFTFYRDAGWDHIGSRANIQFFRSENNTELFTDQKEHLEALNKLKSSQTIRTILIAFLSIIIIIISLIGLQINPIGNYIDDNFLSGLIMIFGFSAISFYMFTGVQKLNKLLKYVHNKEVGKNRKPYQSIENRNLLIILIVFCISALNLAIPYNNMQSSFWHTRVPVPNETLPLFQLSDVIQENHISRIDDGHSNYYAESSSILVPKQYQLKEYITFNGETYSHISYGYELMNERLAKRFFPTLVEYNYETRNPQPYEHEWFDELWIEETTYSRSFIARKDEKVYLVHYNGNNTVDEMVKAFYQKLKTNYQHLR
ncbi:DUF2812 domain-containing protein [Bacillus sp. FJAT-45066]|uniref:DUF2812 domain-containing protein n=1 Tax=Bacillus sp. FJAT-45066 TaxID=2011010 RepID=UPI000BB85C59|nr:DUF2812 domain-containing protein [Bacillus sp. FJAT-45066]